MNIKGHGHSLTLVQGHFRQGQIRSNLVLYAFIREKGKIMDS